MDVGKMMENKDSKVEGLTGGIEYLCKKYKVRDHVVVGVVKDALSCNTDIVESRSFLPSTLVRPALDVARVVTCLRWTTSKGLASLVGRTP